jgi:hypothetical protein
MACLFVGGGQFEDWNGKRRKTQAGFIPSIDMNALGDFRFTLTGCPSP